MPELPFSSQLLALRPQLERLASSWQRQGAQAFGVWCGTENAPLFLWPSKLELSNSWISCDSPLQRNGKTEGELRVYFEQDSENNLGQNSGAVESTPLPTGQHLREQLSVQALLLNDLLAAEADLEAMSEELVSNQDQLLALYDLSKTMRSRLDLDDALMSVAQEAMRLTRAAGGFAFLETGDRKNSHAENSFPNFQNDQSNRFDTAFEEQDHPRFLQSGTSCMGVDFVANLLRRTRLSHGDPILETDTKALPKAVHNLLFFPIRVRGDLCAGLGLVDKADGFNAPDVKLTRSIAEQSGGLIENLLLYQDAIQRTKLQTEMDLARTVQHHLLPRKLPQTAALDLFAQARSASQVGGDFYDFITRPNAPLAFTVGDVTGKGMAAAIVMSMTRTVLRTKLSFLPTPTPQQTLDRTNTDLYDDFSETAMFATVFVGQYFPDQQKIIYANAGHSPVIYKPASGTARLLEADGTALGVLPTSFAVDQEIALGPGDILVVATDGFSEAMSGAHEMFGYDSLLELVNKIAPLSAAEIGRELFGAIDVFASGHPQDDDQTLIVLKGARA